MSTKLSPYILTALQRAVYDSVEYCFTEWGACTDNYNMERIKARVYTDVADELQETLTHVKDEGCYAWDRCKEEALCQLVAGSVWDEVSFSIKGMDDLKYQAIRCGLESEDMPIIKFFRKMSDVEHCT